MTLPSRKKHPITPPSIIRETTPETDSGGFDESVELHLPLATTHDSVWLPAALLATLLALASALQAFGDEPQLRWKRPEVSKQTIAAKSRNVKPTKPVAKGAKTQAPLAKQQAAGRYAVRQAGYTEEEGWALSDNQSPQTSVVKRRREWTYQTAQTPGTPFEDDPADEDDLTRDLERPFGAPDMTGEMPEDVGTLPPPPGMNEVPEMEMPADADVPGFLAPGDEEPETPVRVDPRYSAPATTPTAPTADTAPADDPDRAFAPSGEGQPRRRTPSAVTERELEAHRETCNDELDKIKAHRITSLDPSIRPADELVAGRDFPLECSFDDGTMYGGRHWSEVTYMWKAAANCHKPLYFEQTHLERYGHSWGPCLQPIISGGHFFTSLTVLPYKMGLTPPNECMYPLGYYRPGNCAPYMIDAVPLTWRAALSQGGAAVGVSAILP